MLVITDVYGNSEPVVTVKGLTRDSKVNGDKTLSFVALSRDLENFSYDLIQGQSLVEFDGEEYVIKEAVEKAIGVGSVKEVTAVLKFFEDLARHFYHDVTSGTKTIAQLMNIVTAGTGFTYTIQGTFPTNMFENFGKENKLSLFQTILSRYNAEYELAGTVIVIRERVGIDTDFQFRYGYNVKNASVTQSTYGFSTYVKGFGQPIKDSSGNDTGRYVVQGEYTSPVAAIPGIGIIEADPVNDERVTDFATLNRMMIAAVQDNPIETIELDFVDMRAAGYGGTRAGLGDRVFVIYEPLSDLNIETRITEVSEEFDFRSDPDKPIKTKVTLASINKDITDTLASFSGTSKAVNKVISRTGGISSETIPQNIRDAVAAVESAQNEVEFGNGFMLIDKTNPLRRVAIVSNGIRVSTDGGVTYQTALDADGVEGGGGSGEVTSIDFGTVEIIGTLPSNKVSGSFPFTQITGDVPTSRLTGSIATSMLTGTIPFSSVTGDVPAARVTGNIPFSQITGDVPTSRLTGSIATSMLTGTLPFSSITGDVPAARVTGNIPFTQITGQIATSRLDGTIPMTQITGNLDAQRLTGTIDASIFTGQIDASLLTGSIDASLFTGNIPTSILEGTIPMTQITGNLASNRVTGDIPFSQITGQIATSRLTGSIATSMLTGTIPFSSITGNVPAGRVVTGTLDFSQFTTSKISAANFDLHVQGGTPQEIDTAVDGNGNYLVTVVGPWCRTISNGFRRFDSLMFKHCARYLNINFFARSSLTTASAFVRVVDENGTELGSRFTNSLTELSLPLQIDLGTPTGNRRKLYIEFRSTSTASAAFVRVAEKNLSD